LVECHDRATLREESQEERRRVKGQDLHELHDEVEIVRVRVINDLMEIDEMRMLKELHDVDLL
jgi:hypothetical protein